MHALSALSPRTSFICRLLGEEVLLRTSGAFFTFFMLFSSSCSSKQLRRGTDSVEHSGTRKLFELRHISSLACIVSMHTHTHSRRILEAVVVVHDTVVYQNGYESRV